MKVGQQTVDRCSIDGLRPRGSASPVAQGPVQWDCPDVAHGGLHGTWTRSRVTRGALSFLAARIASNSHE
eukprot:14249991-Alexandrium_andersonii.AAC.1